MPTSELIEKRIWGIVADYFTMDERTGQMVSVIAREVLALTAAEGVKERAFEVRVGGYYRTVCGKVIGPMYLKAGWHESMRHAVMCDTELTWHSNGEFYGGIPAMNLVASAEGVKPRARPLRDRQAVDMGGGTVMKVPYDFNFSTLTPDEISRGRVDVIDEIMKQHRVAIEEQLQTLLNEGTTITRISLQQGADGTTTILVDNIPNASVRIDYQDLGEAQRR